MTKAPIHLIKLENTASGVKRNGGRRAAKSDTTSLGGWVRGGQDGEIGGRVLGRERLRRRTRRRKGEKDCC